MFTAEFCLYLVYKFLESIKQSAYNTTFLLFIFYTINELHNCVSVFKNILSIVGYNFSCSLFVC